MNSHTKKCLTLLLALSNALCLSCSDGGLPSDVGALDKDQVRQAIAGEWVATGIRAGLANNGKKVLFELSPTGRYKTYESLNAYDNASKRDGYELSKTGRYSLRLKEYSDDGAAYWDIMVDSQMGDMQLNLADQGFALRQRPFTTEFLDGASHQFLKKID